MKAVVTGATGFVGGHLVDRLLARGDTVTALARSPARAAPLAERGVRIVPGDLANIDALTDAARDCDVVYHAAAILGAPTEAALMTANRDGTINVARCCANLLAPPRIVLVSSMAAGGPARRDVPRIVDGNDHPVTGYGRSKLAAEQALATFAVPWCILRPPVVYGPADHEGFLPLFKSVKFGIAPMFGDGSMQVSLVHVSDLADAIVLAGTVAGVECRTFYVNHPEIVTGADIVRTIARTMHRSPLPVPIPRWAAAVALGVTGIWAEVFQRKSILHPDKLHEFYQDAWTADASPFIAATGWQPKLDLEHGISDTAAWYRKAGWI
jgi:nucleoside-diphosphate-sugar epimerase